MNRNNSFFNFVCACIPGVGLMYNGLMKKGLSLLFIFMGVIFLGDMLWLDSLVPLINIPLWFYSFFKTYDVNRRLRNGEYIQDSFIFDSKIQGDLTSKLDSKYEIIVGAIFIAIGVMAIVNRYFGPIMHDIRRVGGPVIFILIGIFILYKSFSKGEN